MLQKMYELTRQGVSTVKMMQEAIEEFVHEELFPCGEPPPSMYRRYNPTPSDIQNAMYKVRFLWKIVFCIKWIVVFVSLFIGFILCEEGIHK